MDDLVETSEMLATCRDCKGMAVLPLAVSSETMLGLYGSGLCSSGKNARQSFLRYHSSCDVEQLAPVDQLGACHGLSEPNALRYPCRRLVVRGAGNASLLQIGRHRAARQPLACPASAKTVVRFNQLLWRKASEKSATIFSDFFFGFVFFPCLTIA